MAFSELTLIGADNDFNESDFAGWTKVQALIRAANAGQLQGFKNRLINGEFDVWQRATSFSTPSSTAYTADRWRVLYDGTIGTFTVSRQDFTLGQTDVPGEPRHFLRWAHTSAGSGSTFRVLGQKIEGVRRLAGRRVVMSFYAKADASRTIQAQLAQQFGTGGSPSSPVYHTSGSLSLTTAWQQFTFQTTLASIAGKTIGSNDNDFLDAVFVLPLNTTMTIDIAQVQVEPADASSGVATLFEKRPIAIERALCERYYQAKTVRSENGARHIPLATMRAAPSVTVGVGSAGNITANGFELTHSAAADCTVAADAEL